jgi:NAD(P)-dependent dehydrogenase (short-subunit alcohol dehydrogenase family)
MAEDIATARSGAKVMGIGAVDVRKFDSLQGAVERCVKELGGIDFVMYANNGRNGEDVGQELETLTGGKYLVPVQRGTSLPRSTSSPSMHSNQ